jgi:integrase
VQEKLTSALRSAEQGLPLASDRTTLSQFLQQWLKDSVRPNVRPRTYESYAMIVDRHLEPWMGQSTLAKLGPANVQSYINAKLASGRSPRTVQYHHAVLRRALGQAERWGLVPRNVAKLVDSPKVKRPEIKPLSPVQCRSLLNAAKGERLEALYIVALGIGLRKGELLGLRWEAVNLDSRTLRVNSSLQ